MVASREIELLVDSIVFERLRYTGKLSGKEFSSLNNRNGDSQCCL